MGIQAAQDWKYPHSHFYSRNSYRVAHLSRAIAKLYCVLAKDQCTSETRTSCIRGFNYWIRSRIKRISLSHIAPSLSGIVFPLVRFTSQVCSVKSNNRNLNVCHSEQGNFCVHIQMWWILYSINQSSRVSQSPLEVFIARPVIVTFRLLYNSLFLYIINHTLILLFRIF